MKPELRSVDDVFEALPLPLRLEASENLCRKDLSHSERARLVERAYEALAPLFPRGPAGEQTITLADLGATSVLGFIADVLLHESRESVRKRQVVTAAARQDPELFGPIATEMDRTGKIDPAYRKVRAAQESGEHLAESVVRLVFRLAPDQGDVVREALETVGGDPETALTEMCRQFLQE